MADITRQLKKMHSELLKFQQDIHSKTLARSRLTKDVRDMEREIRRVKRLERDLRLRKSELGRIDLELNHLTVQRKRLQREIPYMERDFKKMEQQRKFGKLWEQGGAPRH